MRDDFAASLERTLWFQVGVFGLSFLLLPKGAGRRPAAPPGHVTGPREAPAGQEGAAA